MPNTLTWNNVTYHAVTDWQKSSQPDGYVSWLYPAVRFLIGEDSTASSAHVIAEYGSYTTENPVPFSTASGNNYLDHCLNSAPTTGANQAGSEWFADNAQGKFFTIDNTVQACGYPRTTSRMLPITDNIMSYARPYIVTNYGSKGPGETVTSKIFYSFLSGNYANARYVQKTYTVESVSITYNANGGTGTTTGSTRIKGWDGCGFTLSIADNGFQAPGTCAFVGWSTTQHSTPYETQDAAMEYVDYLPSSTVSPSKPVVYAGDSDITLYAVWRYTKKTVWYNANIPSGVTYTSATVPSSTTKQATETITIGAAPTVVNMRPPLQFAGWNTKSDGSGANYAVGSSYNAQTSATMYAKWTINYTPPSFTTASAIRSNSSGVRQVDGTYLHVEGSVVVNPYTDSNIQQNQPVSLTVSWTDPAESSVGVEVIIPASNGTFNWTSSNEVLDPGKTYIVTLSFKDTFINTYSSYEQPVVMTGLSIGVAFITFSTNARGYSAAFGRQAEQYVSSPDTTVGRLDIKMNTYFAGDVIGLPVDGTTIQYNANNELEVVGGSVSSLGYTEITGGEPFSSYTGNTSNWPSGNGYDYSYTPPNQTAQESFGYGWKQRKWADSSSATGGRLEQWVWFWTNYSDNNSTSWWYTYAMPRHMDSSLETFNAKPNFIPNLTGVTPSGSNYRYGFAGVQSINVTNSGASDGLDYTFSSTAHASVNDKYLWQVYFDGYWGV